MKWSIHIYDPKTETTTTRVKDYPGTSASMADAPAVVAKASRDFRKHMKYILAVPHREEKRQHATNKSHATKKKSPSQLQREIDDVLRAADREAHGYDTDPLSDRDYAQAARFEAKKYGLSQEEALRLAKHPRYLSIREDVESWRAKHGFPAANSPLARGYLLSKLR